ncbi:hypothetical protein A0U90_14190 (plasmid) [Kozakia baliensis]|nr:hypothetical protein A0U90_14190 [Kozakia baliensis]
MISHRIDYSDSGRTGAKLNRRRRIKRSPLGGEHRGKISRAERGRFFWPSEQGSIGERERHRTERDPAEAGRLRPRDNSRSPMGDLARRSERAVS